MQKEGFMRESNHLPVKNLVLIAMFGAMSFVLMLFEFPVPFLAPPFYEMDFSEVPVLIGTFAMGPAAGACIELVKILLKLLFKGTSTAYIGDIANFLIGCTLAVPAGMIYRRKKTRKSAVLGMAAGTLFMVTAGCFINGCVMLPWYAEHFFGGMEPIIEAGAAVNKGIDSVLTFVVIAVAPFNLLKGILTGILTFLLYKRISGIIKHF